MKNSIVIITYNQEQYIESCIESVLSQKQYVYELIISDDFSYDNTWKIILNYKEKYPNIIKAYRNEKNIGIFNHLNLLKNYVNGDLISIVAGDDLLPSNILKKYIDFYEDYKLDSNDPFLIITNSYILRNNGERHLISNYKNKKKNLIELTLSEALYVWETGISAKLFKNTPDYMCDIGYQADLLYHIERIYSSKFVFFLNEVGYIYRENVGVTSSSKFLELQDSKLKVLNLVQNKYNDILSKRSKLIIEFYENWIKYNKKSITMLYIKMVISLIRIQYFLPYNSPIKNNIKLYIPNFLRKLIKKII